MKNKIKMQKGITLVALIITIIILLILAVVTINSVKGDGIILYAESARSEYTYESEKEEAEIIVKEEMIEARLQERNIDLEEIEKKLKVAGFKEENGKYISKSGAFIFEISEKGEIIEYKFSEKEEAELIVNEEIKKAQSQGGNIDLEEIYKKLKAAGFKEENGKYISKSGDFIFEISEKGEIIELKSPEEEAPIILEAGAVIPEGATYYVQATSYTTTVDDFFGTVNYGPGVGNYKGATATLTSGTKMPNTPQKGDVFVYGDYEYRYGWLYESDELGNGNLEWRNNGNSGWGVRVLNNNKSEYSQLCEKINGENVKYLTNTFSNTKITKAPILPTGIVDMSSTFENTSITEAPVIPNGVTNMYSTFSNTKITKAPVIPNGVIYMSCTFSQSSITTAPVIPSSVTDMYYTFYRCTSLEGEIEINAAIESSQDNRYNFCFNGTVKPIILTGTSPILQQLANTATNNNVSVK